MDTRKDPASNPSTLPAVSSDTAAPAAAAHIAAVKDDFDQIDEFVQIVREHGREVCILTLDDLLSRKEPACGIICFHAAGQPADTVQRHNRLRDAAAAPLVAVLTRYQGHHVRYLLELGVAGPGNINSDPNFVNPGTGDFHLSSGSPCIDVGDYSGSYTGQTDIHGDNRVIDISGKGDGTVDVDMGADEYAQ